MVLLMVRQRRSVEDYSPEANRFETWLMQTANKSLSDIKTVDELVSLVEEWLKSIDVYGHHAGSFGKSLITHLLGHNLIMNEPTKAKEVEIVRDFLVQRTGRRWLETEQVHLARLYQNPKVTVGYIARELGRSKASIYSKAKRIGIIRPEGALTEHGVKKRKKLQK